jgi:hypothetical protein
MEPDMTVGLSSNERLAVLEQKVSHMDEELAILLQARGVRWAIIAVSGLMGFLAGISHWIITKS